MHDPSRPLRILHVEDSPDDAELVRHALGRDGPAHRVERVETEADFVAALDPAPDVILCDYDMPLFSAERALEILRERGLDLPFIVVSNHIDQNAAVIAMQHGAGDYLSKRSLGRLPKAITGAVERAAERLERARVQEALRASEAMNRGILEALNARIAVVDRGGRILAANRAWEAFERARQESGVRSALPGTNYLELLEALAVRGNAFASRGSRAIRAVTSGERPYDSLDYQFTVGASTRWFLARVVAMDDHGNAVVSHEDITDQMMSHMALEEAHRRLQALSKRVLSIQEEERRAIAGELHDDVGQTLAALKIGLHRMGSKAGAEAGGLLAECQAAADEVLVKLRHLAQRLRPPQLDQLGLGDALAWLGDAMARASGVEVAVEARDGGQRPSPTLEIAAYRIAQEAMSNAVRHSGARRIRVTVESDLRLLKVAIADDGAGFDLGASRQRALQSGSLGIIGMEERAQLAGGRVRLRSVPGQGTTVVAILPLAPDAVAEAAGVDGVGAAA